MKLKLFILGLFLCGFAVRFCNFANRINFGPEQSISLLTSASYVREKISLLGEPNIQRVTSYGQRIFHPPLFNYLLVPLLIIFRYDPVPITAGFTILNLLTAYILYLVTRSIFGYRAGIFTLAVFLFDGTMISHSLFIWNQNLLPIFNILIGICIYRLLSTGGKDIKTFSFLTGLLSGLCVGIEFLYFFVILIISGYLIIKLQSKLKFMLFFIAGLAMSLSTMIIFDIKHDFYFVRTLFRYFLDVLAGSSSGGFSLYHLLSFWPLYLLGVGLFLAWVSKKSLLLSIALTVLFIVYNLYSPGVQFKSAAGMNPGLNYPVLKRIAGRIADDKPDNFNVAMLVDFDSQAHPLRYLLQYEYNLKPLGPEEYSQPRVLYVLAPENYPIQTSNVFELSSFRPYFTNNIMSEGTYTLFKLTRN